LMVVLVFKMSKRCVKPWCSRWQAAQRDSHMLQQQHVKWHSIYGEGTHTWLTGCQTICGSPAWISTSRCSFS
jgi:hypothetical protein